MALNLARNLGVFGGYRGWKDRRNLDRRSDWKLDIRGSTAGAVLRF